MIRLEHTSIPVAAFTHPGMKRKNNEDCYAVSAFTLDSRKSSPILLAVLCDGIGGHRAGEVAAEMAVNRISQDVGASDALNPPRILENAIQAASEEIREKAAQNAEWAGMGSTCAAAWIIHNRLYMATVGDSRIYLIRGGSIQRLSTDHTWVQEALERGVITPPESINHPNAHIIRRYLGSPTPPDVDLRVRTYPNEADESALFNQGFQLMADDRILLCSDGLTDMLQDDEILANLQKPSLEFAGQDLVEMANARGGLDNITLIAIQYPGGTEISPPTVELPAVQRKRWLAWGCVSGSVLVLLLVFFAAGWWWLNQRVVTSASPTPGTLTSPTVQLTEPNALVLTSTLPAAGLPLSSATPPAVLPIDSGASGATLTPWPTNTPKP